MGKKFQVGHLKSLAVILAATVLVVIGSTLAYFTSVDEVTNKFVGTRLDVSLLETKWDPHKSQNVVPGDELEKNPQIRNNERTPAYVFLRVTVPCDTPTIENDDGTPKDGTTNQDLPMYKFMTAENTDPVTYSYDETLSPKQKVNSQWKLITNGASADYSYYDGDRLEYVYVYAFTDGTELLPLNRDEITAPLFDRIRLWNFNEAYDPDKSHDIRVEAFGIQTDLEGYSASDYARIWNDLIESGGGD